MSKSKDSTEEFNCNNCRAPLDYRSGDAVAYCVYCNEVNTFREEKQYREHYMLTLTYNRENIRKLLVGDLLKIPGIPEGISNTLQITKMELRYEPYYVVQVHGNLKWSGLGRQANFSWPYKGAYRRISFYTEPEEGEFDDRTNVIIYAGEENNPVLSNYKLATKGRKFFGEGEIKKNRGTMVQETMTFDEAEKFAFDQLYQKHARLLNEELDQLTHEDRNYVIAQNHKFHVPIWYITWKIGEDEYTSIIDGASGVTLQTDMPRSKLFIVIFLSVSLAFSIIGLLPLIMTNNDIMVIPFIYGLILGGQTLWKNRSRKFEERKE